MEYRKRPLKQYKYLTFLDMLFITLSLICDVTAFRMVDFFGSEIPLSGFIIPLVFALADIVSDGYGYHLTKRMLFCAILNQCLFGIIITLALNYAPSPPGNVLNTHYSYAFEHIIRTNITTCFSVTSGMLVNSYLMSKMKIYMNGKKFWFRTIVSSGISEIVLCTVAYLILFSGLRTLPQIFIVIFSVWWYKMVFTIGTAPITALIGAKLKRLEQIDIFDRGISYNPIRNDSNEETVFETSSLSEFDTLINEGLLSSNVVPLSAKINV